MNKSIYSETINRVATDIAEIREKRDELSQDILVAISDFEEETGQGVKEVQLGREQCTSSPNRTVNARVKIARDDE